MSSITSCFIVRQIAMKNLGAFPIFLITYPFHSVEKRIFGLCFDDPSLNYTALHISISNFVNWRIRRHTSKVFSFFNFHNLHNFPLLYHSKRKNNLEDTNRNTKLKQQPFMKQGYWLSKAKWNVGNADGKRSQGEKY